MTHEEKISFMGNSVVIFVLPAYLGLMHQRFGVFALYVVVAGLALASVDHILKAWWLSTSGRTLTQHSALCAFAVGLWGGVAYSVAILIT